MIRRISGQIVDVTPTHAVIDVNGVGYLVATTNPGLRLDASVTLWTYLAVRETALDLYGFATRDELDIFELLLTLPKIGPKSAMQIMSQADITLLKEAVAQEDATYLSKMSGIGKKTAEKIVAGLKDSFAERGFVDATVGADVSSAWQHEAVDALVTLGYPQKDAREAVANLPANITDTSAAVAAALRELSS